MPVSRSSSRCHTGQGLVLDTFQLQDIQAEGDYLADLGRPEAARAVKEAAIARRESEQAGIRAEEEIAVAHRDLALKQAEINAQTDAAAILARGQAEAEAMTKKAGAYERYGEAAVIDILAEALPRIVAEAARPIGQIGNMTVLSSPLSPSA
jgi:flotillin